MSKLQTQGIHLDSFSNPHSSSSSEHFNDHYNMTKYIWSLQIKLPSSILHNALSMALAMEINLSRLLEALFEYNTDIILNAKIFFGRIVAGRLRSLDRTH